MHIRQAILSGGWNIVNSTPNLYNLSHGNTDQQGIYLSILCSVVPEQRKARYSILQLQIVHIGNIILRGSQF